MGKTVGLFLNLQCDIVTEHLASIYKTDQSAYQFQQLAAIYDSAMNKWNLTH